MPALRSISVLEFIRRINPGNDPEGKYALFLGAGCSITSGIPAAAALVKQHWLPNLRDLIAPERADLETWATDTIPDYDTNNPAASYGKVFDRLFDSPEKRQREIEKRCEHATPGFGYAILAQLIAQHTSHFNIVLTTNFDDLVADALYLYSNARPLVIHHDALAGFIRPTRSRPLVVKLHGDHRLAPRNTNDQTARLDQLIEQRTAMLLHDRGIIFMGYGGNDDSICTMLENLSSDALSNSAYWIHSKEPTGRIAKWLLDRNGTWVQGPRFDEVMLHMQNELVIDHPQGDRFTRIFQAYHERRKELSDAIDNKPASAPEKQALQQAIANTDATLPDMWKLLVEASRLKKIDPDAANQLYQKAVEAFPHNLAALNNYANFLKDIPKDHIAAEALYKRAIEADPNDADILGNYANFLTNIRKDHDAAEAFYQRALDANANHAYNLANFSGFLFAMGRPEAHSYLQRFSAEHHPELYSPLSLECAFYTFAHLPDEQRPQALSTAKRHIIAGTRSPGWNFAANIDRAVQDKHPEATWLPKLAAVINDEARPETLDEWPLWKTANA